MATTTVVIRRDQAAAVQAARFLALVQQFRSAYFDLIEHQKLMRGAFDDADPQAIDWSLLQTLWGAPVEDIAGENSGKVLWDRVNGTLTLLDTNSGNNDFQKMIQNVL